MKLKLSLSKLKNKLVDTVEQQELTGTSGRYKLIVKCAPFAVQENDAEFRSFPDFDFLLVPGSTLYSKTESGLEKQKVTAGFDQATQINFFTEVRPLKDTDKPAADDDDLGGRCRTKKGRMLARDYNLEEVLNKGERARGKRNNCPFTASHVSWTRLG